MTKLPRLLALWGASLFLGSCLLAKPNPSSGLFDRPSFEGLGEIRWEGTANQAEQPSVAPGEERDFLYPLRYQGYMMRLRAEIRGTRALYQGDIDLGLVEDLRDVTELEQVTEGLQVAGYGLAGLSRSPYVWPKGIIPFVLDQALEPQRQTILRGVLEWNERTNVFLVELDTEKSWLERQLGSELWALRFVPGKLSESSSYVGLRRVHEEGLPKFQQPVTLGTGLSPRVVTHEVGHALGLLHEQQRPDRDGSIRVTDGNIKAGYLDQYSKDSRGVAAMIGSYDLYSVMHYSPRIFAKDGAETFAPADGVDPLVDQWRLVGTSSRISAGDIEAVNTLYPKAAPRPYGYEAPSPSSSGTSVAGGGSSGAGTAQSSSSPQPRFEKRKEPVSEAEKDHFLGLIRDRLPSNHPAGSTQVGAYECRPKAIGTVQTIECEVSFSNGSGGGTARYRAMIHSGSSGPYVMSLKKL